MAPAPSAAEDCLNCSRVDKYKGGTIIDEEVRDLETHRRTVCDPDGYRPKQCLRCGCCTLHVHSHPNRRLFGEHGKGGPDAPPPMRIVVYICANNACEATWRILPLFLARHLWRAWPTVERVVRPEDTPLSSTALPIPKETQRRWRARFAAAARVLVALLATSNAVILEKLASEVGYEATRGELVDAHASVIRATPGARLAPLAALTHRLTRGIRLM